VEGGGYGLIQAPARMLDEGTEADPRIAGVLTEVLSERLSESRKQRTDIGKYSSVNRIIQLWNQLPEDALGTLSCKPSSFRKSVRKVINKAK
jgi:hypothetical protein